MELDAAQLSTHERYKLLIGAIVPRPIALVSSQGPGGALNLAPFSFFAGVSADPMSLVFCPANKPDGTMKDTLRNVLPTDHPEVAPTRTSGLMQGRFVVNIVSHAIAARMAACAEELPYGASEFALSGLTATQTWHHFPPRVLESSLSFACSTMQVIRLATGRPSGGNIVIGLVEHIFIRDGVIDANAHIDPAALDAIGRMGGQTYSTTRDRFTLPMGIAALATLQHS